MGPSRRHLNTTFVDFGPGPLSRRGSADPRPGHSSSAGIHSFILRVGVLSTITAVALLAAVESSGVVGPVFGALALGCSAVEGRRLWSHTHVERAAAERGPLQLVRPTSPSAESPREETAAS